MRHADTRATAARSSWTLEIELVVFSVVYAQDYKPPHDLKQVSIENLKSCTLCDTAQNKSVVSQSAQQTPHSWWDTRPRLNVSFTFISCSVDDKYGGR